LQVIVSKLVESPVQYARTERDQCFYTLVGGTVEQSLDFACPCPRVNSSSTTSVSSVRSSAYQPAVQSTVSVQSTVQSTTYSSVQPTMFSTMISDSQIDFKSNSVTVSVDANSFLQMIASFQFDYQIVVVVSLSVYSFVVSVHIVKKKLVKALNKRKIVKSEKSDTLEMIKIEPSNVVVPASASASVVPDTSDTFPPPPSMHDMIQTLSTDRPSIIDLIHSHLPSLSVTLVPHTSDRNVV